jgi:hypothetical protein
MMLEIGRKQKVEFRFAPSLFNFCRRKPASNKSAFCRWSGFSASLCRTRKDSSNALSILLFPRFANRSAFADLADYFDSNQTRFAGRGFFKQERVGMDGRRFLCYKFRTMRADADEKLHREAYRKNIEGAAEANAGDDEKPLFGKVKNDPRVTRVGVFCAARVSTNCRSF